MESMFIENLFGALGLLFNVNTLLVILLGVVLGLLLGILPGIGGTAALAITFPITYDMTAGNGILFLIAVYSAAEYGGSIPAILINTPGTGAAAATILDGYPLCQKGFPKKAMQISLASGVFGGIFSTLVFILMGPLLAWFGLQFGPIEMFAVGVFGLSIVCSLVWKSVVKGFLAVAIGALLASIGPSNFSGLRYTFDQHYLLDGIPMAVAFIGFFAVPQAVKMITEEAKESARVDLKKGRQDDSLTFKQLRKLFMTMVRGSVVGSIIGIIPGAGTGIACFIAYNEEKRFSKRPEEFGKGVEEGISAPESANNSVVGACLVPTLTLGIPGSSAAALIMGLLIMKGINPGPMLFQEQGRLVLLIFTGLIVINIFLLLVGILGINVFALVTRIPQRILGPFIIVLVLTGTYSYQQNTNHAVMAMVLGIFGYILSRAQIPNIPLVLAFIMAPIMEYNLIHALMIHRGDLMVVFRSPICIGILVLSAYSAVYGYIRERRSQKRESQTSRVSS